MEKHMETEKIIGVLIEISSKKKETLKELLYITKNQTSIIGSEDLDLLADAIKQKQSIMDHINAIDMAFIENYTRLKKALGIVSIEAADIRQYPSLKQLKINTDHIMKTLQEIDEVDKINTEKLQVDFDKVKEEMKRVKVEQQSHRIAASYKTKYQGVQGMFVDNKENS